MSIMLLVICINQGLEEALGMGTVERNNAYLECLIAPAFSHYRLLQKYVFAQS